MKLKAIKTRLIIKKIEQEKTSAGGIFVGSAMTNPLEVYATVIDVGPGVKSDIKVGDTVLPDWRAVVPIQLDGETFLVVEEQGIHGVFDQ